MSSLRVFSIKEAELINAIGNAMIPEGGNPPYRFEDLVLDFEVDRFFSYAHRDIRMAIKLFLKLVEYAPVFTKFKKFSSLSEKERQELLEKWEKSKIPLKRQIVIALKGFIMLTYYNRKVVQEKIGFRFKCNG
jgi:hypothetical protein